MRRGVTALAGALLVLSTVPATGRTWTSDGYGDVAICLVEGYCDQYYTSITLGGLDEYDSSGYSGSYQYIMSSADTALGFKLASVGACTSNGTCTTRTGEAAVPSGGLMYSTPASNGDPVMRMSVLEVESGDVSELVGGANSTLPTPLTAGDLMFAFEFEDWALAASDSTLNFTFRINTVIDGYPTNTVNAYDASTDVRRLVMGSSVYVDLPMLSSTGGPPVVTSVGYSEMGSYVGVEVALPASVLIKYGFSMWFLPLSTGATTSSPTSEPLSVLNLFSGGFEYCAAADCNINTGVLSVALDRLGVSPTLTSSLAFSDDISDFSNADRLPFAASTTTNGVESHPLILQILYSGDVRAISNASELMTDGSGTYIMLTVSRLSEETYMTSMGETLTAPAGALKVNVTGVGFSNRATIIEDIGLSLFLFAMEDGGVVTNVSNTSIGMYARRMNISDMYLSYSMYGEIDGYQSPVNVQSLAYTSGANESLIHLLLEFPSVADHFSFQFFIGSNSIEYGYPSTDSSTASSASGSQGAVDVGTTDGPTQSMTDGKAVTTKMLTLPRGEFGLCFDTNCSTSAVKLGFSGLASSEGARLGRFAGAAAFDFSYPERLFLDNGDEVWSTSFSALVPQSRIRPPIPYNETLAASYPAFHVRVDQYLAPGTPSNAGRTLSVPRGALKFSFNMTNWQFQSATDQLLLNVTLSSVIGAVPGANGINVTAPTRDLLRILFGNGQFLDIPLLAEFDGDSGSISVTPVVDSDVGVVLVMAFGYFYHSLVYDPVVASHELVLQDVSNMRTPVVHKLATAVAITLSAILGLMILASAIRCLRKTPVKVDLHGIFF